MFEVYYWAAGAWRHLGGAPRMRTARQLAESYEPMPVKVVEPRGGTAYYGGEESALAPLAEMGEADGRRLAELWREGRR